MKEISVDKRTIKLLQGIKTSAVDIFLENLVGIYIHGSLAQHSFHWERSDIDFIVVIKTSPSLVQKENFIKELLYLEKNAPPKGIEMSIVLERHTKHFVYPTPYELHFSNSHKSKCYDDIEEYCRAMCGTDRDLAAHFMVIKDRGLVLYGKPIPSVFGEIPTQDFRDSIIRDVEDAVSKIKENPVDKILNLCRVCAYIKEELLLSKEEGGCWGITNLPVKYRELVSHALDYYREDSLILPIYNENLLIEFAQEMIGKIKTGT